MAGELEEHGPGLVATEFWAEGVRVSWKAQPHLGGAEALPKSQLRLLQPCSSLWDETPVGQLGWHSEDLSGGEGGGKAGKTGLGKKEKPGARNAREQRASGEWSIWGPQREARGPR